MSNHSFQPITIGDITFRLVDGSYHLQWLEGRKRVTAFLTDLEDEDLSRILRAMPVWIADVVLGGQDVLNAKALAAFYDAVQAEDEARDGMGPDDPYES